RPAAALRPGVERSPRLCPVAAARRRTAVPHSEIGEESKGGVCLDEESKSSARTSGVSRQSGPYQFWRPLHGLCQPARSPCLQAASTVRQPASLLRTCFKNRVLSIGSTAPHPFFLSPRR